jgi:hypothetical protein
LRIHNRILEVRMTHRLFATVAISTLIGLAASAQAKTYETILLGTNEVPPNASPATGFAMVTVSGDSLIVHETFADLIGGASSAAHIHCCTAPGTNVGVAVPFVGFPAVTSGTYDHTFDLLNPTTYTAAFLAGPGGGTALGAEAALIAGLDAGQAYANIHNPTFPGGEIRGFLTAVPEPATWALMIGGFGLAGTALRRRSRLLAA